jgi:FtsP/CotA-like multicopper oxidase with cupredoxin domain
LPEPDLAAAKRHELVLQGGMMGGGAMAGLGGMMGGIMNGMGGMGGDGAGMSAMSSATWAINGHSMIGDGQAGMAPLLTLTLGQSCILTLRNQTAWWHPMHLHGHSFRVLSRNGVAVPHRQWGDTVLVAPRDAVQIAFVADNHGDWMLHCHVMDHQISGLMAILRIA